MEAALKQQMMALVQEKHACEQHLQSQLQTLKDKHSQTESAFKAEVAAIRREGASWERNAKTQLALLQSEKEAMDHTWRKRRAQEDLERQERENRLQSELLHLKQERLELATEKESLLRAMNEASRGEQVAKDQLTHLKAAAVRDAQAVGQQRQEEDSREIVRLKSLVKSLKRDMRHTSKEASQVITRIRIFAE